LVHRARVIRSIAAFSVLEKLWFETSEGDTASQAILPVCACVRFRFEMKLASLFFYSITLQFNLSRSGLERRRFQIVPKIQLQLP
jgi:hypothetical protein